jgi:drug/metabolite transporter (DMT)-like permease
VTMAAKRRLGWSLLALSLLLLGGLLALFAAVPSGRLPEADRLDLLGVLFALAYAVFAVVGALIVSRRPDNAIGWLLCAIGAVNALW